MPSPVGHSLAGLTVHVLTARGHSEWMSPGRAALLVAAANAADLDLLFRFVDGRNHHQAETHSIGAALIAALLVWVAGRALHRPRSGALALASGAAWLTHLLLDYAGADTHPPIGILALWPFDSGYYKIPWPLFLDIGRTLEWATVRHDVLAVGWETLVLGPLLLASWRWRRPSEA